MADVLEATTLARVIPELRIVEAATFAQAQTIKANYARGRPEHARRPRHLLAGLLRCGHCGAGMSVCGTRDQRGPSLYCSRRGEGGRCDNAHTYHLRPIEQRVAEALKRELADPRAIAIYLEEYRAERKRLALSSAGAFAASLAQAEREIERIVETIGRGSERDARSRLPELRRRRDMAQADLDALPPPGENVAELHPKVIARYLAAVEDLAHTLTGTIADGNEAASNALCELIVAVAIHYDGASTPRLEVTGWLAQLMGVAVFPEHRAWPLCGLRHR